LLCFRFTVLRHGNRLSLFRPSPKIADQQLAVSPLPRKDLEVKKEVLIKPPCDELVDQLPHVVWWSCPSRRILRGPKVLHPLPPQFPPLVLPHSPSHLLFLPPSFSCFSSFFSSCFSSCFSSFFFNCLPGHSVLFQYYPNLHPGPGVPVSWCPCVLVSLCPGVPCILVSLCPGVPVSWCPGVLVSSVFWCLWVLVSKYLTQ